MRKVRVMQLIAPLSMAGAERVVQMLSNNLDSNKFENSICAFVNHRRIENSFTEAIQRQGVRLDRILLKHLFGFRPVWELVKLSRERRIEIFHSHGYRADAMGYIASRMLNISLVSTVHWGCQKPELSTAGLKARVYDGIDFFVLRKCARVIVVSENASRELRRHTSVGERIEVIHNTLDPAAYPEDKGRRRLKDELGIKPSARVIGFLGRLSEEKGLIHLLAAMPKILQDVPNCHCILAGNGPMKDVLREQCCRMGIAERVHMVGEIDYVRGFYESLDLLVLPSLTEGMPMVLLEAKYFGLPIVASRVGGIPEIITHGENGLLVEPGADTELAHSILALLKDDSLAKRMSEINRRSFGGNAHVGTWASRYEKIYLSQMKEIS